MTALIITGILATAYLLIYALMKTASRTDRWEEEHDER